MIKVCKIRCYPNKTQENIIYRTLAGCRYIHNLYIEWNISRYQRDGSFLSAYECNKILTSYKKEPKNEWLKEISSKAIKDELIRTEKSFKKFFKKKGGFPKFKSKKHPLNSYFFIKDSIHFNTGKKNIIKIPILGNIRITERNYLPDKDSITSGRVVINHNKFYLVFIYNTSIKSSISLSHGIGIDLGIKEYGIISNGRNHIHIPSFIKEKRYREINTKIEKLQQVISHKAEINYGRLLNEYLDKHKEEPNEKYKNIMKGGSYNTSNIKKLRKKINHLFFKRSNYVKNKIYQMVAILVRTKPKYITMEDLNIKRLLEKTGDHKLHRFISESNWYLFKKHLTNKCKEYSIELRIAEKFYASSKTCSSCGYKKKSITLSERTFTCLKCGLVIDRDVNAAINLCNTKKYIIA